VHLVGFIMRKYQ